MSLKQQLETDLKTAMKKGDADTVSLLRFLLAQIHNKEIEKGKETALTDEEVLGVLRKEAKKREEAIALFERGGRGDLVAKETKELAGITAYLPALLHASAIGEVVDRLIAQGINDFPTLMRETMTYLKGKADGKAVRQVIEAKLKK